MNLKRIFTLATFVLCPLMFFSQVKISKNIKASTISRTNENALYFVDFWATWCGPCIHVSKYLESLQRQFPEDFYILSLTQENPEIVNKFMTRHDVGLAVAIDYQGETFAKNNIQSLPYGILYNAMGEKLWEGHAADLKNYNIRKYLRSNKTKVSIDSFFQLLEYEEVFVEETIEEERQKKNFVFAEDENIKYESSELQIIEKESFIEYRGSLKDIISHALLVYKGQVNMPEALNKYYSMRFKKNSKAINNKERYILKSLKLKRDSEQKEGDVIMLNIENPSFWDTNQIDWGENNLKFLVGNSDIQGDNVSLDSMIYKLSGLVEMPILFKNKTELSTELHDWQINYEYVEFMISNLIDYGIQAEKVNVNYPQYNYYVK